MPGHSLRARSTSIELAQPYYSLSFSNNQSMQQEQTVQLLFHSEVHRTAAARLYMSVLQLLSLPLIIYYYVCVCVGGGGGGGGGGGILLAVFSFPWKCIGPYAYCTAYIVQHC